MIDGRAVADKIRQYTVLRSKLIDQVANYLLFLENPMVFHAISFSTCIISIITIFEQIKRLTLFSLHPLMMLIGTFIFIAEGIVAYHNRSLVDTLAPIMQKNKKQSKVSILSITLSLIIFTLICFPN